MEIRTFDPETDADLLPELAAILVEAVAGGASVGFMAGFDEAAALAWWQGRAISASNGEITILVSIGWPAETGGWPAVPDGRPVVTGTVSLVPATMPNQPHRADIAKMLVREAARGHGVGAALLAAAEALALRQGRTTLVLDTITGSTAARLYERAGWERVGDIPAYALMPDGTMAPTTVYTRRLT
jgi:GNAT superfamily N-acetyltransferase